MFQLHETTLLIPPTGDGPVKIDNEMVSLVRGLWARGWRTLACCQDNGEAVEAERGQPRSQRSGHGGFVEYYRGWAWLKMPTADAISLVSEISDDEIFGPRVKVRWQHNSWRMHIPVIYEDGQIEPAPYAQIYFPKQQIAELAASVAAHSELLDQGMGTDA